MSDLIDREYAIKRFCEDGTYLERHGVGMMTLCEAKQRAVDLIESFPSAKPEVLACGSGELVQESGDLVKELVQDCISRKMAIDAMKEHRALYCDNTPDTFSKLSYAEKSRVDELDTAIATLVNLPSAQSQHKKGKWISNDNGTYSCSVCQSWIPEQQHCYARYCLYCGADMRGEE